MYKNGNDFLNKLYSNMHMEDVVMHTAEKSDTPDEKIGKYLDRLERVHNMAKDDSHKMDLLKEFYYRKYIINELPESYVELQKRIAREEGHGDLEVTDEMREELLKNIQSDQKNSLDSWIEYLSSDDAMYPMWFKNYAFQGMLKLSSFDKNKGEFGKRTSKTTNPYIELNREVLAQVYNVLSNEVGNRTLNDEQVKALENGISFKKLYTFYLTKQNYVDDNKSTEGIWIKYDQKSDSKILCDSLQGKNTGWCTAGYETAKLHIDEGDFYVYYTKDSEGEYTNPRVAIRMRGHDEIAEVRGVATEQNLEEEMLDITDKKLDEFADKDNYKKRVHDMRLLTTIDKKVNNDQELTQDELRFLYEIDGRIEGFGWKKDPRIDEITSKRNVRHDLTVALGYDEEKIVTNEIEYMEALSKGIQVEYAYSDIIMYNLDRADTIILPKKTSDQVYFPILEKANKIIVPEGANYYIGLENLKVVNEVVIDNNFRGNVIFERLYSVNNFSVGDNCSGSICLDNLGIANRLRIGSNYTGNLDLSGIETTLGLYLRDDFTGTLSINGIKYIHDFKFPSKLAGLYAYCLEEVHNTKFPEYLNGSLDLSSLRKAVNSEFPEYIENDEVLLNLKTSKGIKFPKYIGGTLEINRLRDTEVLQLPESYKNKVNVITFAQVEYIPDEEYFNKSNPKHI
ncbi:MAG: hypothetical protein E7160_04355 [Firmicutes bacterium]|nr:hypothetical protein [Bacillota bacterium]